MAKDEEGDEARIRELQSETRTLDELIAAAQRLRREIDEHLEELRRRGSAAPERRTNSTERRKMPGR